MKAIGFLVIGKEDDWDQPLGLRQGKDLPKGGLLEWTYDARAVFTTRKSARAAIDRTEHYRLAFGSEDLPERQFCKIVPLVAEEEVEP